MDRGVGRGRVEVAWLYGWGSVMRERMGAREWGEGKRTGHGWMDRGVG